MEPYHNWRIFSGTEPVYFPQSTVTGMTPFIRENDINFAVKNLKPDASANIFFDEIRVNNFSQRASIVNANSSVALSSLKINQGLYATTSKAYAEVLGTSITGTHNLVYVNDNFISVKINNAPALTVTSSDFTEGDFVYQTNDNVGFNYSVYNGLNVPEFTFLGRVKKWEYIDGSNGVLVVDPLSGRLNLTSTAASSDNIFNLTKFGVYQKANNIFANNRFQTGETVQFAKTSTLAFQVSTSASNSAYVALSSAVTAVNTANSPNRSIVLSTNNTSRDGLTNLIGNTIYVVSGTNMGFSATIVNVVANTTTGWNEAILNKTLPETSTSNTIYSIGDHIVDDVGAMYGIFHIPSLDNLRWLTGERVLTITDTATHIDNEYKMRAVAKYNALGKINSIENARNTVVTEFTPATQQAAPKVTADAPKINDRKNMAQTFFTPRANEIVNGQVKGSYGIYVTSVDLFFKSKPTDNEELLPFTVAITKVENGLPSNEQIASRTLEPAYIITSNTPNQTTNTFLNNIATKFTFSDPVYLLPSTEYAVVLLTESPDYEVWTASVGEEYTDELGNVRKVSDQPYVGNFFKSQNASNWNPILNQDLMFRVNRASFESSNTVYFNLEPRAFLQQVGNFMTNTVFDMVKVSSTDQIPSPTNISYDIRTKLTDGTEAAYLRINNNEIYNFGKDTNISSSFSKRRRLINYANVESVNVRVTMTTNDETTTPIINGERMSLYTFQNIVNNAGIANNLITITNPGGAFVSHSTINVQFSDPDVGTNKATGNITPGLLSSGEILGINIINPGAGYLTTPTITIVDDLSAATANAVINGETDASGGNILARYQTKIVELEDGFEAGDLVVRLNAIKPAGTDVHVYLKVLSDLDAEPFTSKKWLKMTPVTNNISPDQNTIVPIEYRYSLQTGEIKYFDGAREMPLGGKFKYFAVKIRLTSADPAVVPSVESLRVIAVPAG